MCGTGAAVVSNDDEVQLTAKHNVLAQEAALTTATWRIAIDHPLLDEHEYTALPGYA